MEHRATIGLLDDTGQPFGAHIDSVLRALLPRLEREFPTLRDETVLVEVLEEAGRKIADHERRDGPIEKLHAYAWVAIRSVATSRLRRGSMRIARATFAGDDALDVLGTVQASIGTPEQIEAEILVRELLAQLTPEEQLLCVAKRLGFSSKEIAEEQGTTVERVNTFFHRVKQKMRDALRGRDANGIARPAGERAKTRTA